MRGEIICIGDELMSGRVADRNASYLAARLWPLGIEIGAITLVGDRPRAIKDALSRALGRSDFVVVSGGLGVTDDDITAAMAAEVFGLPLAESQRMVKNLRDYFAARGEPLARGMRKLAWLPEGAEVLSDTCAGFRLERPGGPPVYFLPGVPAEMRQLTDQRVVPELLARMGRRRAVAMREVRIFGLMESEVGRRLQGLDGGGVRLGYYPVFPEVQVTVTALGEEAEAVEARAEEVFTQVMERLGEYVITTGGERLEERVGRLLTAAGLSLAVAESCTGGLIGHRLTGVSGSSAYFERGVVVYSNRAKQELLGVAESTLAAHGAVSAPTAEEMAAGIRARAGTALGLAVTGIAGPTGGSADKPVGTVYFGLAADSGVHTWHRLFPGERDQVKAQAAETALVLLMRHLEEHAAVRGA